jgi:hypothetical protein
MQISTDLKNQKIKISRAPTTRGSNQNTKYYHRDNTSEQIHPHKTEQRKVDLKRNKALWSATPLITPPEERATFCGARFGYEGGGGRSRVSERAERKSFFYFNLFVYYLFCYLLA